MAIDPNGGGSSGGDVIQIDEAYEFFAPKFFDFMIEESEEEIHKAEGWFETSLSYAPSPFMSRVKVGRSVKIDSLVDFGDEVQNLEESELAQGKQGNHANTTDSTENAVTIAMEVNAGHEEEVKKGKVSFEFIPEVESCDDNILPQADASSSVGVDASSFTFPILAPQGASTVSDEMKASIEACTPIARMVSVKGALHTNSKNRAAKGAGPTISRNDTSKKSTTRQPSALKPKNQLASVSSAKGTKLKSTMSTTTKNDTTKDIAQENQAIKRQKLDAGRARQILNVKSWVLPHKSKLGFTGGTDIFSSTANDHQGVVPFVSAAEMVRKFETKTREIVFSNNNRSLSHEDTASVIQRRPKLTLTRPKEPEFETSHRARAVRVKSSSELEEEMLARIPKFKARPLNKKILEAPTLLALHRSIPHPPEFQEFHLKTTERAIQHAETSSLVSETKYSSTQDQIKPLKLTQPRPPQLETALRARPPMVKSSQEMELEEFGKIPKFKARPLNKKILESRGDLGVFTHPKPRITNPQEFHFATNERMGPPAVVMDLFDKLSLHSEPYQEKNEIPRITIPNPFHLYTEERGMEKEKQFMEQILRKQVEEERARIPKANPYPYTTDYPVMPPKPEPKQCTRPEVFQLESLVKHDEEMQRMLEEKQRQEREEAERRKFKAQPIMREDPIPLPERERRPLTEVQKFVLHVDHRAVDRSEFDKKIKEKEVVYKRLREECETAKMVEEEKAVKQMRRTMVPHARPIPKFGSPFLPQRSSKGTTKPKSPMLQVKLREERRRHASHMR